jgi:hypothetical protein
MPRPVLLAVDGDPAAKRRFHGPGRGPRRQLAFVVVHVQPFALGHLLPRQAAPRGGM